MWNAVRGRRAWSVGGLLAVGALAALLAGCGGASGGASNVSGAPAQHSSNSPGGSGGAVNGTSSDGSTTSSSPPVAQYLIKSLAVSMTARDTRATATELQSWILTTDPKAVSAGLTYTQDEATYDVSMTFAVEASVYPQIEAYLAGYAEGHGGKLLTLQESVQDVTNDFVDSQSRLTNLRAEQARLQTLMSQAGSLNDILTIEQRLTDVEGQIEDIQTHLALLAGQTTMYMVRIQLNPLNAAIAPKPEAWDPLQVLGQAWGAAMAFGQWLLTLLIWLGVFALYIVPVVAIYWLVRRYITRRRAARAGPVATTP